MYWLGLTLFCAFALATADALTKKFLSGLTAHELVVVRFVLTGLLLVPVLAGQPLPALAPALWGWLAVLLPLEITAMFLYMAAIRSSPLALTLPYLAFTPVFSMLLGFLLLGEQVTATGFAGIALVTAGAWTLNAERATGWNRAALLAPLRAIVEERGSRLMLVVSALYGVTSVLGKGALRHAPGEFFGAFYFVFLGLVVLLLYAFWQPRTVTALWRHPLPAVAVGVAMAVMVVTHFMALEQVEVAYMISVKRTSLLFGILYGALLFGEPRLLQHLAAGSLMVAGVVLIATGSP